MFSKELLFSLCICVSVMLPAQAQKKNGLPPTSMDSFVRQAAGQAENIYGDEGHEGPPPFDSFVYQNRINSGIFDIRDKGLTTGHGSLMPSAWGKDEFLGAEWSRSGANNGNSGQAGPGVASTQNSSGPPIGNPSYQVGKDWITVRNPDTAQIMGYMAPGETYAQFFSGQSGHILPQYADVGQEMMKDPAFQKSINQPVQGSSGR